jgi:hypothetical protein
MLISESLRQFSMIYAFERVSNVFGIPPFYDYSFEDFGSNSTIRLREKCIIRSNFNVKAG